ncbi:MAG: hypothetical protein MI757_06115 [Pirellulales bacterium]|nr:hypothetical protein [Pirellulales bacterium]
MGLTLYYEWKTEADVSRARRKIVELHALAEDLPFDEVTEIYEQDPPGGQSEFCLYDHEFRHGDLYLTHTRADGEEDVVSVPARHAMFFHVRVEGAETASIGLASHPPVVVHHEDILERREDGSVEGHLIGQGEPIEFLTHREGYYSWHGFCKTQYAGNPKLGGEANFLKAHLSLIELFDQIQATGLDVEVRDDSKYAEHRDVDQLLGSLREWNAIIAKVAGAMSDALADQGGSLVAPIKQRPDFEHLEAQGITVLKAMAERQRQRKSGDS